MKVRDVMNPRVFTVVSGTKIKEVARLMVEKRIGSAVVHDGSHVIGIVTDRDILTTITKKGRDKIMDPVDGIMSRRVHFIGAEADVEKARQMMIHYGIKKLPVMVNGELGGIVTSTDLAAEETDFIDSLRSTVYRKMRGY
jgi:CBS domain-containing protein